jgi:hypothetical protein
VAAQGVVRFESEGHFMSAQPLGDEVAQAARLVLEVWPADREEVDPRELLDSLRHHGFTQRVLSLAILYLLQGNRLVLTDERFLARARHHTRDPQDARAAASA